MGSYPNQSDDEHRLWLRIASNLYDYAIAQGKSGVNPPSFNDSIPDLIKKSCYTTAVLAP